MPRTSTTTNHRSRLARWITPSGRTSVGILVAGLILLMIAWHMAHVHDPPPVSRTPLPVDSPTRPSGHLNHQPPLDHPADRPLFEET